MAARDRGLGAFIRDEEGVFAVIFGLMAIVLVAVAGAAVDYTLWMAARQAAQEAADAGVLAAAVSSVKTDQEVERVVAGFANPMLDRWAGLSLASTTYDPVTRRVTAQVRGDIATNFVQLVGVNTLPVMATAVAERATEGQLELALVLDNTWSMSDSDGAGSTKIQALKNASNLLLTTLWEEENENIRVGIVPYAQYVNVGLHNRNQPWMSVAADTTTTKTTTTERQCEMRNTRETCTSTPKTCTRTVDGVTESYSCPVKTCTPYSVTPYEYCWGGDTTTSTTITSWHGCVLSRIPRNLRLSDAEPFTQYIGRMHTSKECMTPVQPLTNNVATLRASINAMVVNNGSYRPLTYIPTGLIWGINVVSPSEPFTQGAAYDPANREPRKAIVLMTDGDNTLRYNSGNGRHEGLSTTTTTAATQKAATDNDTQALCTYAKAKGIEVFTVAFGLIQPSSQTMLQNCATSTAHYFAATSSDDLNDAFENIADQLRVVRIVQ
jgi:Flp pilus assembly protein TadG